MLNCKICIHSHIGRIVARTSDHSSDKVSLIVILKKKRPETGLQRYFKSHFIIAGLVIGKDGSF